MFVRLTKLTLALAAKSVQKIFTTAPAALNAMMNYVKAAALIALLTGHNN